MPVVVRLDSDDLDALAAWLRDQLDDTRLGRGHAAILDVLAPHLHATSSAGQLTRRVLLALGSVYADQPGYRDDWRPQ
ncbi:hypothetical protein BBK82_03480 [Lentzea guizhouensis]|uniref:Uncharacterized protein n=1 Tax=Lentzea guizhouensis TaxID=1586287 RepID=A0A1B2HC28_9PSEU|nr:hypothetical protein [Lentzea guizhouensis]ANZ35277.1 hypothetical protein BBK82_03480 [Lentzea guizhouensis]